MSGQHTTPLWQTIMYAPMPEPAKRVHIGLGEHRHVWLDSDMRHFAHQIAGPIQAQRDELLAAMTGLLAYFESGNCVPVSQATIKANSAEVLAARAAIAKSEGGAA